MAIRSWLFVPGDSAKKLGKAPSAGADVLIVDLEDSVVPERKPAARELTCAWLKEHGERAGRWVRINALDTDWWREDLAAVLPGAPDGIVVPKSAGPDTVALVSAELDALEARHGLAIGSTRIMPLVSETAAAALTIPAYVGSTLPRLAGLTWGAEDLSAAIGATRKRDAGGAWTDTFRMVRSQALLAAHALGVAAIDTLHADFGDAAGLQAAAEAARADGFAGMLAIHPAQVAVINAAFTPSTAELAEAQAIVSAFAESPDAGALQIGGKMIDRPHLQLALRVLASAE
ncbi:citrate lyase subunit beta/citryl-CoA lyase [Novosphingobium kunmingense]|uniref:Citrate lyase subunit beta/citryl-CoA lyase n=1 Tax=Novosphingobium kunmingense TaxID=1211806 RepID=A0A2N0H731_9SPHN|nr:CoA ester lyase [Novosphingobium kunmingense]PKB14734.1 citrate lyase subunit beta/citryl-CoA lyase [Novosphingobium kunmingense]